MKQEADFRFDPSNYSVFQERVRQVCEQDPFAGFALEQLLIGEEAAYQLPEVIGALAPGLRSVLLVMDRTPMKRDGKSLKPLVRQILSDSGYEVSVVELEGDQYGVVHPDFHQVEVVRGQIQPGMVVVSLGSGVLIDICKYACFMADQEHPEQPPLPLIAFTTANSVPAYSSTLSIISRDGVKRTWRTRLPNVILCDLKVLRDSPRDLNMGGIGDMCAMYIASLEWFLGTYLGIVPDSPAAKAILVDAKKYLQEYAGEIGAQSLTGMEMMAKILTLGGLAMSFLGDSTPMSGYEHGVAHLLDMSADYYQRPIRNHGSQVAIAGILVLLGFERFLGSLDPSAVVVDESYPDPQKMEQRIFEVFGEVDPSGKMAAECWRDYQKKLTIWKDARPGFERLLVEWPQVREVMKGLILPSDAYVKMLHESGHPLTFPEIGIDEAQARWAYKNAYTLRKRLSTADLLIFLGWMDEDWTAWVFSEAERLVNQARETPPA